VLIDKVANKVEELNTLVFTECFGAITDLENGPDAYLYFVAYD